MKEKLKYYSVKTISFAVNVWTFLSLLVGGLVLTLSILKGFKVTLGNRSFEFDGLFDILLPPIVNWFYKV